MRKTIKASVFLSVQLLITGSSWFRTSLLAEERGVQRIYATNEVEVIRAITNAFAANSYREMKLYNAVGQEYLASDWHPTNGFALEPIMSVTGAITNVTIGTLRKRSVPYVAYFHIFTTPVGTNSTKVTVRTVVSKIIDGKEPGIHLTWANHYRSISPIRQEEENVMTTIAAHLSAATGAQIRGKDHRPRREIKSTTSTP